MKQLKLILVLFGLTAAGAAIASNAEIAERIKKVGEVCIEGHDCASGAAASMTVASAGGGDVESNYNKSCATCHNAGVAGAPKFGEPGAWDERIANGMDALYASAINGKPPAMPAKGMCFSCSDDDLKALVDYMIEASQ